MDDYYNLQGSRIDSIAGLYMHHMTGQVNLYLTSLVQRNSSNSASSSSRATMDIHHRQ